MENKYLQLLLRIILGVVFIFAGIEKIADPASFAVAISNYRILPYELINIPAIAIPWIEICSGILIIYGKWIKENSAIISALLLLFNLLIIIALIRGLDIECGCFGTLDAQKVGFMKLGENFLLLLFGYLIFKYSREKSDA